MKERLNYGDNNGQATQGARKPPCLFPFDPKLSSFVERSLYKFINSWQLRLLFQLDPNISGIVGKLWKTSKENSLKFWDARAKRGVVF